MHSHHFNRAWECRRKYQLHSEWRETPGKWVQEIDFFVCYYYYALKALTWKGTKEPRSISAAVRAPKDPWGITVTHILQIINFPLPSGDSGGWHESVICILKPCIFLDVFLVCFHNCCSVTSKHTGVWWRSWPATNGSLEQRGTFPITEESTSEDAGVWDAP